MAISFVAAASAQASSVALPVGWQEGDLAIAFARRTSSSYPGTNANWTQFYEGQGASGDSVRLYYRVLQTGDTTVGSFSSATTTGVVIYRGADSVGAVDMAGAASGSTIDFPALTLTVTDGTSWVVVVGSHRSATDVDDINPTGTTNRTSGTGGTSMGAADTNGGVASWSATSDTVDASHNHSGYSIELVATAVANETGPLAVDATGNISSDAESEAFTDSLEVSAVGDISSDAEFGQITGALEISATGDISSDADSEAFTDSLEISATGNIDSVATGPLETGSLTIEATGNIISAAAAGAASNPIVFVGAESADSTGVALPAGWQAGDLAIAVARRTSSSLPNAHPDWTTLATATGGSGDSVRVSTRVLEEGDTVAGGFASAVQTMVVVYRNVDSIGAYAVTPESGDTTWNFPALTLQVGDGSSHVLLIATHRTDTNAKNIAPSGTINRTSGDVATLLGAADTGIGVISWSERAYPCVNQNHTAWSIELKATGGGTGGDISFTGPLSVSASGNINTQATGASPAGGSSLKYSAPDTTGWTHRTLPVNGGTVTLNDNTDYVLNMNNGAAAKGMTIKGGRNIVLIGAESNIQNFYSYNEADQCGARFYKSDAWTSSNRLNEGRIIYLEGWWVHGYYCSDGFQFNCPEADVYIQNCRIDVGMWGRQTSKGDAQNTPHPDIIQTWGNVHKMHVYNLTGRTTYQGIMTKPDYNARDSSSNLLNEYHIYERVNLRGWDTTADIEINDPSPPSTYPFPEGRLAPNYFIWTNGEEGDLTFNDVYLDHPRIPDIRSNGIIWADGDNTSTEGVDEFGPYVIPDGAGNVVNGKLRGGLPSGGDYVPIGLAGLYYETPGYDDGSPFTGALSVSAIGNINSSADTDDFTDSLTVDAVGNIDSQALAVGPEEHLIGSISVDATADISSDASTEDSTSELTVSATGNIVTNAQYTGAGFTGPLTITAVTDISIQFVEDVDTLPPGVPPIPIGGLPVYQAVVISSRTGEVLTIYDTPNVELHYSRVLNGIGSMVLTLTEPDPTVIQTIFELDNFIEIRRQQPGTRTMLVEETYLVRSTHYFSDEDRNMLLIGGQSLNHLIARRIIDPEDDPLGAGGYSTKAGVASEVMRDYAREQLGDLASPERQIPDLTILDPTGVSQSAGARLRFENLLETLQDLAIRGQVDFRIKRTSGKQMELEIGNLGVDRTKVTNYGRGPVVYLTPFRGNLTAPSMEIDRTDEKNFVYALGPGQGGSQFVLKVPGYDVNDSLFNRIEFTSDSRSSEKGDPLMILDDAMVALSEERAKRTFSFTPTGHEPGNIYRMDWDVGDKVTVFWGAEYDLRITEVEINIGENGEEISVTVENIQ